jgi:outer membrane protein TolC
MSMAKKWAALIGFILVLAASRAIAADEPTNDELRKLVQERVTVVTQMYELTAAAYRQGAASLSEVSEARRALLAARLEAAQTKAERVKVLEEMVTLAEQTRDVTQRLVDSGEANQLKALQAKADLLTARINLEREKAAK